MFRTAESHPVTLTTDETTTPIVPKSGLVFGTVFVPAGSSITSLTYYGAPHASFGKQDDAGTFTPCYKSDGSTAVTQTVAAGKNFPVPSEIASIPFIRVKGDAAGAVVFDFSS